MCGSHLRLEICQLVRPTSEPEAAIIEVVETGLADATQPCVLDRGSSRIDTVTLNVEFNGGLDLF